MRAHLKSMFQICASLRPGWIQVSRKVGQGLVGAGRHTSEGDSQRANGSVSSSPSGSSWIGSISIQSILPTPFCSALIPIFFLPTLHPLFG